MSRIRGRLLAVLVVAGVLAAGLSGCGTGAAQVGAAAIVGDVALSLSTVQRKVDAALAEPGLLDQVRLAGGTPADLAREIVGEAVRHELLVVAARRENIVVRDQDVDAEIKRRASLDDLVSDDTADSGELREVTRDRLVAQALARKLLPRIAITYDITTAGSEAEAQAKARRMAAGPAQAAAVLGADPRAQRDLRLRGSLLPQSAALFPFGTPAGTVVAAHTSPAADGWTVLRVTARTTTAPPVGDPAVVSQIDEETLGEIGRRFTQPLAHELGVRVNPRYGVWDPLRLGVVPAGTPVGLVLPAVVS